MKTDVLKQQAHAAIQNKLGYRFKDTALLQQALTHRSYHAKNNEQAVARIEEKAADAAKVAVECANLVNHLIEEQFDDEEE